MDTILVSGASGIIGYGILRSLRQSHPECRLIGTAIYEVSAAQAFCDVFEEAPATNDEGYLSWLQSIIIKYNVALVIPGIEIDVVTWNSYRKEIEESGARILLNAPNLIELCVDKWIFYQTLVANRCRYAIPTSLEFDEEKHEFPLLLKPRKGSGSKGVVIVQNQIELKGFLAEIGPHLMLQPVVGTVHDEYTVSAFFDFDSNLCAFITMKRSLSRQGYTEKAEIVKVDMMAKALSHLAEIFLPVGPTNFQFRMDKGQLKLLEINPRISSATSIRAAFGYNESAMSVEFLLKQKIPSQPSLRKGRAIRYVEDIIYFDSTDF